MQSLYEYRSGEKVAVAGKFTPVKFATNVINSFAAKSGRVVGKLSVRLSASLRRMDVTANVPLYTSVALGRPVAACTIPLVTRPVRCRMCISILETPGCKQAQFRRGVRNSFPRASSSTNLDEAHDGLLGRSSLSTAR